ncbi:MAG: hypothetical protein AAF206_20110 [Bacteroidota bacterium]
MKSNIRQLLSVFSLLVLVLMQSCYYDNEEDLYPVVDETACDTLNVSFVSTVFPILEANCVGCHSGSFPAGNIPLEDHADILVTAQNGKLVGVIAHEPGFSAMPPSGDKLPECNIKKIQSWVEDGAQNN